MNIIRKSKYLLSGILTLIIFVLLFSSYSNTFYSSAALDDFHSFVEEPNVKIENWTIDKIINTADTKFGYKRWLPMLTFAWDIWFGHGDIKQLHITNLVIHYLNFLAVFLFVWLIVNHVSKNILSKERFPFPLFLAICVAALWALQPVQASAVTYIVQRMTSIMALFYILSLTSYVAARILSQNDMYGHRNWMVLSLYSISMICAIFSFLSKENSAMIPLMILVTEWWFFNRDLDKCVYNKGKKHYILSLGIILILFCFAFYLFQNFSNGYNNRHFDIYERILTQFRIVVWYISLFIYPNPIRFSLEHDIDLSTTLIDPLSTMLCAIILILLFSFSIYKRKHYPILTYGIIWFILNNIIESSVVALELIFEHRIYLPSVGLALSLGVLINWCCSLLFARYAENERYVLQTCCYLLIFAVLTLATFERNKPWVDPLILNEHTAAQAPTHPRAHANLSVALFKAGRYERAIEAADRTIELGRGKFNFYYVAANSKILSFSYMKKYQEAVREGESLLRNTPQNVNLQGYGAFLWNLANVYMVTGDHSGCISTLERLLFALSSSRNAGAQYAEKAVVLYITSLRELARTEKYSFGALQEEEEGVFLPKNHVAIRLRNMGFVDSSKELLWQSVSEYPQHRQAFRLVREMEREEALNKLQISDWSLHKKYVKFPDSVFNAVMATALLIQKQTFLPSVFKPVGQFAVDRAITINPHSSDAYLIKAWYEHDKGELPNAVALSKRSIELAPSNARAWMSLGVFAHESKDFELAAAAFKQTLILYPGCPSKKTILAALAKMKTDKPSGQEEIGMSALQSSDSKEAKRLSAIPAAEKENTPASGRRLKV